MFSGYYYNNYSGSTIMSSKRHGADLSRIIVLDIEATCWEVPEEQGDFPNEIIEIGICELNVQTSEISKKRSYLVKPQFSYVSEFCTTLTGITQADINQQRYIPEVLKDIERDYSFTKDTIWASYGEYDRVKLSSDAGLKGGLFGLYGIERAQNCFAKSRTHLNVKTLMALKERLSSEMGMDRALKYYGLELEGKHHRGSDDAWNISKILLKVLG